MFVIFDVNFGIQSMIFGAPPLFSFVYAEEGIVSLFKVSVSPLLRSLSSLWLRGAVGKKINRKSLFLLKRVPSTVSQKTRVSWKLNTADVVYA